MQKQLYIFEHAQRKSAITLVINALFLLAMFGLVHHFQVFGTDENALFFINLGFIAAFLILLSIALYFFWSNKLFRLILTEKTLSIEHPIFELFTWSVDIDNIKAIKHNYDKHSSKPAIWVLLKDGNRKQLTMNYAYNRKKLYQLISQINQQIELPENHNRF